MALAVAQTIADSPPRAPAGHLPFPDGLWFIPLSDITAPDDLTDHLAVAVAQAIGWQFKGIALQRLLQIHGGSIMPLHYLGDLWLALGQSHEAQQQYEQVFALVQAIHSPYAKSCLHASYGRLQHLCGDPKAAITTCAYARQLAQQSGIHAQEQGALVHLGQALRDLGDLEAARHSYQQAIARYKAGIWIYRTADAHAGPAALLLSTQKVACAVTHSEAALALLAQLGLAGANEPFRVYWTAVCVLQAAGAPRAADVLRTAYQYLQVIAAKLADEAVRRSFLEDVAVNRHLVTRAQAVGMAKKHPLSKVL